MAARLTREQRMERLVTKCRERISALDFNPSSLSQTPDSKLGRLAQEAGYERVSTQFCQLLDAQLGAANIGTYPALTDPTITRDTRIHLYDLDHAVPHQEARVLFTSEKQLSEFMQRNFAALSYVKEHRLKFRKPEARIEGYRCRVDLLAEDRKNHLLVGFELKHDAPGRDLVSQAGDYMDALRALAEKEGLRGARLVIVTGQPDPNRQAQIQEFAKTRGVETTWLLYRLSMKLTEA